MTDINYKDAAALNALVTETFGDWSNTVLVDQDMINQYAQLSGDKMWLHRRRSAVRQESPFGAQLPMVSLSYR